MSHSDASPTRPRLLARVSVVLCLADIEGDPRPMMDRYAVFSDVVADSVDTLRVRAARLVSRMIGEVGMPGPDHAVACYDPDSLNSEFESDGTDEHTQPTPSA